MNLPAQIYSSLSDDIFGSIASNATVFVESTEDSDPAEYAAINLFPFHTQANKHTYILS